MRTPGLPSLPVTVRLSPASGTHSGTRFEVDDELEVRPLNGRITVLGTLQDFVHEDGGARAVLPQAHAIGYKAPHRYTSATGTSVNIITSLA